jgi:hypothetical protein
MKRQLEKSEVLMATDRRKKGMKIGTPDNARFCAGVQLNAPTYRTDDACRQAGNKTAGNRANKMNKIREIENRLCVREKLMIRLSAGPVNYPPRDQRGMDRFF